MDAVVLVGEMTERGRRAIIGEARTRGRARLRHALPAARVHALADVSEGLGLLTTVLRDELGDRVFAASAECSGLREEVHLLIEMVNALVGWVALIAPTSQLKYLAAALPPVALDSVTGKLGRMEASIQQAEAHVQLLCDVCASEDRGGEVHASSVARLLHEPLVRHVVPWGELRLAADGDCIAAVPRPVFVCMLSALVAHAAKAARRGPRSPGLIDVRVVAADHEATVVVEVFYSGPREASFGPDVLASGGVASNDAAPVLSSLREHARQYGGDLLVEDDELGMTARLLLPTPTADVRPTDGVGADYLAASESMQARD